MYEQRLRNGGPKPWMWMDIGAAVEARRRGARYATTGRPRPRNLVAFGNKAAQTKKARPEKGRRALECPSLCPPPMCVRMMVRGCALIILSSVVPNTQ